LHLSSKLDTLQIRLESSKLSIAMCAADLGVEPSSRLSIAIFLEGVSKLILASRSGEASSWKTSGESEVSFSFWLLLAQLSGDSGLLADKGEGGLRERQGEGGTGARAARSGTV